MLKKCGTCGRWAPIRGSGWVKGQCNADGKQHRVDDRKGCLVWLNPTEEQINSRLKAGILKSEEVGA
ncbi:MAG: hypothetical protein ABFD08_15465 [Syntrophomonas sp.]